MAPPTPLPPPSPPRAWLPRNELWLTVRRLALLTMAPPLALLPLMLPRAWLWVNRQLLTVRGAPVTLTMAPPWALPLRSLSTALFYSTSLVRVQLLPAFTMAPRPSLLTTMPAVIVKPALVTVTPPLMAKIRLAWLALMASLSAPGPSMSRLWAIAREPLASVMVWPLRLVSKTT